MHFVTSFGIHFFLYSTFASLNIQNVTDSALHMLMRFSSTKILDLSTGKNAPHVIFLHFILGICDTYPVSVVSVGLSSALQGFQLCALTSDCGAGNSILNPLDPSLLSYRTVKFLRISYTKGTYYTC